MVRIRLRRVGAKKKPTYRIVVADQRSPRDGRFIENIGHYDPRTDPPTVVIHEARALHWLSVGAQPSGPVERFFAKLNLADKLKAVRGGADIDSVATSRVVAPQATPAKVKGKATEPKAAAVADLPAADESIVERAKDAVAGAVDAVEPMVEGAVEATKKAAHKAAEVAEPVIDDVVETTKKAAHAVAEAAEPVIEDVVETTKKAAHAVAEAAEPVVESVAKTAKKAAHAVAEAVADAAHAVADAVSSDDDAAPDADAPSTSGLASLGLSTRVEHALIEAGIDTPAELTAKVAEGDDALLALAGIGAKAVEEIRERLGQAG